MKPTQPTPTLPAGSGSPLASQQHPSSGREGGCPQKGEAPKMCEPRITFDVLMEECDEVEGKGGFGPWTPKVKPAEPPPTTPDKEATDTTA